MAAMEYQVGERSVQELHGSAIYESRTTNYAELVAGRMALEVKHLTDDEVEFDLRGVDVSFANALRRIMLSEVPTMAIEAAGNLLLKAGLTLMVDELAREIDWLRTNELRDGPASRHSDPGRSPDDSTLENESKRSTLPSTSIDSRLGSRRGPNCR